MRSVFQGIEESDSQGSLKMKQAEEKRKKRRRFQAGKTVMYN